jgi:hypothetical protein
MRTVTQCVRSLGQTGSDRHMVKPTRLTQSGHYRDKKLMGDPDAAESPFRLQAVKAAPPTRAVTLAPGKYAREMALVNEAAKQGNIGEFAARVL